MRCRLTLAEFIDQAKTHLRQNYATALSTTIRLRVEDEVVELDRQHGFRVASAESSAESLLPEFRASSWETLLAALLNQEQFMAAYQRKELAANGYLPQFFELMIAMQPERSDHLPE